MYNTYHAASLYELSEFLAEAEIEGGGFTLLRGQRRCLAMTLSEVLCALQEQFLLRLC